MAKNAVTDWDENPNLNTDIGGTNIDEGCAPSGMNNAVRTVMSQLKAFFKSTVFRIWDATDVTKKLAFALSGLTTATTRTLTVQDKDGTIALVEDSAGSIFGSVLSNDTTDPTNDIAVASGSAMDSTNTQVLRSATSLIKRLDAAWAVGTGNGGRMSAAAIANTTYHYFYIRNPTTGVVDAGFDVSPTAPTLPTGYTQFRRIGSVIRLAGVILPFLHIGDTFYLESPTYDQTAQIGTTATTTTLTVPTGISVGAFITGSVNFAGPAFVYVLITSILQANNAPSSTLWTVFGGGPNAIYGWFSGQVQTNTSGQIRMRSNTALTGAAFMTRGWVDTRGQ